MRFSLLTAALAAGAIMLAGCAKDASREITGSYSYKTSGTLTLVESKYTSMTAEQIATLKESGEKVDTIVVGLSPEQGQMHILDAGGQEGSAIITFNDILGNADITGGTYSENYLKLDKGHTKTVYLTNDGALRLGSGIVEYYGEGAKYEDMLLLNLTYEGEVSLIDKDMTIIGSDVHCVAQYN